jgi:hypothetical protein
MADNIGLASAAGTRTRTATPSTNRSSIAAKVDGDVPTATLDVAFIVSLLVARLSFAL